MMRWLKLPAIALVALSAHPGAVAAEAAVTLAELAAAPADKQLSYTFALQQVRAGRLDQAATALRQVLKIAPDWDAARLFYAAVLFRLNDLQAARTEFSNITRRPVTVAQQEEAARYIALIESRTGEVHEAAFLPPTPAQAGIASLLAIGAEQGVRQTGKERSRIDEAFQSAEIAEANDSLGGGHGLFVLLGEAGDPSADDAGMHLGADGGVAGPTVSLGQVRLSRDVIRAAFGTALPQDTAWGGERPNVAAVAVASSGDGAPSAARFLAGTPESLNPLAVPGTSAAGTAPPGSSAPRPRARPKTNPDLVAAGGAPGGF